MIDFDKSFARLINSEGGFSNNPADDGNWTGGRQGLGELKGTKYGIAAASYPYVDIENLTLEAAKAIYKRDFWDILGDADGAIKYQLFDASVNHGRPNAIRFLQRAIGVADDGDFGPHSLAALQAMEKNDVLFRFLAYRFKFWAALKKFDTFGRGWVNRGADDLLYASEDN